MFVVFLFSGECDSEYMMPGEAMAEDISISLSSDEELSNNLTKKTVKCNDVKRFTSPRDGTVPNSIRIDALKLSEHLKCNKNVFEVCSTILLRGVCLETGEKLVGDTFLKELRQKFFTGGKVLSYVAKSMK